MGFSVEQLFKGLCATQQTRGGADQSKRELVEHIFTVAVSYHRENLFETPSNQAFRIIFCYVILFDLFFVFTCLFQGALAHLRPARTSPEVNTARVCHRLDCTNSRWVAGVDAGQATSVAKPVWESCGGVYLTTILPCRISQTLRWDITHLPAADA